MYGVFNCFTSNRRTIFLSGSNGFNGKDHGAKILVLVLAGVTIAVCCLCYSALLTGTPAQ